MNKQKRVLILLLSATLLLANSLITAILTPEIGDSNKKHLTLSKDTVRAAINIHRNIYDKNKYVIGFHYEMLEKSSRGKEISIDIIPGLTKTDYWEKLVSGELDIIVADDADEIPKKYRDALYCSIPVAESGVWVVKKEDLELLEYFNNWISYYSKSADYEDVYDRYFRKGTFSPYELLIKEKSKKFGWDWRLLAAIIHQESRFSMHAQSYRGAMGLMQIMPSTAKHYGAVDILDPKVNIEVGIRHLNRLQKQFLAEGMDKEEAIKFTLAAYNAGESKVNNCRELAHEYGYDTSKWDEVSKVLSEVMISGQTLAYVDSVMNKYEEYKLLAKR